MIVTVLLLITACCFGIKRKTRAHVKTFNFRDLASSNRGRCLTEIKYEYVGLEVPKVVSTKFCFLVCSTMQFVVGSDTSNIIRVFFFISTTDALYICLGLN
jgi:hypothetical protein